MKKYVGASKMNEVDAMRRAEYIEEVANQCQKGIAHLPDAAEIDSYLRTAYEAMGEIEYLLKHHD